MREHDKARSLGVRSGMSVGGRIMKMMTREQLLLREIGASGKGPVIINS